MNDYEPETDRAWRLLGESGTALLHALLDTRPGQFVRWLLDFLAARLG